MNTTTEIDIAELVRQMREEGYCVLRGHYPREALASCYEQFRPILDEFIANNKPNRGPGRYYVGVPMQTPFYNPAFFDDDIVNAVLEGVLGGQPTIQAYSTDTPVQGSIYQDWHSDMRPLFPEEPDLYHPPAFIALNFTFMDVTTEHGPFEVAPSTHRLNKQEAVAKVQSGELPMYALPLAMGDVLIRDPRCLHRGTPNTTDEPRIAAVVGYVRKWFHWEGVWMEPIPAQTWESLSEREQQLFKMFKPAEYDSQES